MKSLKSKLNYSTCFYLILLTFSDCKSNSSSSSSSGQSTGSNSTITPYTSTSNRPNNQLISNEILSLINDHRTTLNLSSLQLQGDALSQALDHSNYMADNNAASHDNFIDRSNYLKNRGLSSIAENIGFGQTTAQQVVQDWLNSPSHKNAIEGNFSHTGIAVVKSSQGINFITQIFVDF